MKPTPAIARAAYALLQESKPFAGWHLPPAENVKFSVMDRGTYYGKCWTRWTKRRFHETLRFEIVISTHTVHTMDRLLRVMAHEMIHVKQGVDAVSGAAIQRYPERHGADFQALQTEICAAHKWDNPLT